MPCSIAIFCGLQRARCTQNLKQVQQASDICVTFLFKYSGIQLLEHEEVIFNYHEKVRVQEAAITKGSLELETLEKEVRDLKTAINEGRRQLELRRKEVPVNGKLEGELVMLQIEVGVT